MKGFGTKWITIALLLLSFGMSGMAQDSLKIPKNTLKLDLVGVPMTFLYLQNASYPRLSIEYERRFHADSRASWIVDTEYALWEEEYIDAIDGVVAEVGNTQQNFSTIGGMRLYLFYGASKKWRRVFFVEPRLALTLSRAKLTPYVFDPLPVTYRTKLYALPRCKAGLSIAISRHLGVDASADFLIQNGLGSGRKSLSQVFELNFTIAF